MRRHLLFYGLLCAFFSAFCQEVYHPTLLNLNRISHNPALCGSNERISVFLGNRSDAYRRYNQVQAELFHPHVKLGSGVLLESYQSLLESQLSMQLNLSYRVLTLEGFWQFGLAPVAQQYQIHTNNLNIRNGEDALAPPNALNRWTLNFNAGLAYKTKKVLVSLAALNIAQNKAKQEAYPLFVEMPSYTAFGSYSILLGKDWKYIPSLYFAHYLTFPDYVAMGHQVHFQHCFLVFQYGLAHSWSGGLGANIKPKNSDYGLNIGYVYAQRNLGISPVFVHELFLTIGFGHTSSKKEKQNLKELPTYQSPVYF